MAEYKFLKGSKEREAFNDIYTICQDLWIPEDKNEYWEKVVSETDRLAEKYNNTSAQLFVNIILSAFMEYLQTKMKEGTNED